MGLFLASNKFYDVEFNNSKKNSFIAESIVKHYCFFINNFFFL